VAGMVFFCGGLDSRHVSLRSAHAGGKPHAVSVRGGADGQAMCGFFASVFL